MPSNRRRAINLTIDAEIVEKARALKINVWRSAEEGIRRAIAREEAKHWAEANGDFVSSWNEYIAANGLPLRKYRSF
jgi:antitoxin CcdA